MAQFTVHGIHLRIPDAMLEPYLRQRLEEGQYEWRERGALLAQLRAGDSVLDFGAGAGYVSALAAGIVGAERVVAVEPSARMHRVLRRNLDANGAAAALALHAAVVPDSHEGETADFNEADAFWASSLAPKDRPKGRRVHEVPAVKLSELLAEFTPSVVVMDAEGVEAELCLQPWPDGVRLLVLEIHPKLYPQTVVREIFDALATEGFAYRSAGSGGPVIVFERIYDAQGAVARR